MLTDVPATGDDIHGRCTLLLVISETNEMPIRLTQQALHVVLAGHGGCSDQWPDPTSRAPWLSSRAAS
jgi:hypothetical protein